MAARRGELQDTAMPCFACGSGGGGHRKSRANIVCRDCGHEENAGLNAARNFQLRALPGRAVAPSDASRGSGCRSQGALTAIASPSGPAAMRAPESRDGRDGNPDFVRRGELQ